MVTKEQQDQLREHLGHQSDTLLLWLSEPSLDQSERLPHFLRRLNLKRALFACNARILRATREDPDLEELIPPDDKAELLLRYYAFYSREAEHAIAELERLQSGQSGKLLLPRAKAEVTAGN